MLAAAPGTRAADTAPATQPGPPDVPAPRIYYVAPGGDDGGPGSAARPFGTIQRGADAAGPSDVVKIAAGVYAKRVALIRSGASFGRVVHFEGAGPDKTVIDAKDAAGPARGAFDTAGQDYLEISGIGVRNASCAGFSIAGSWQVKIENCRSFNTTDSGIKVDKSGMVVVGGCEVERACWHGGEESISVKRSQDVRVIGCHIHDTGHEGIDVKEGSKHVRIIGNHIHGTQAQGLYAEAWDSPTFDVRFERNRVHDCLFGVAAGSECGGVLSDVWFVDNLIYDNHGPGMIAADWGDKRSEHPVRDVHFVHNTVYKNGRDAGWGGGMAFENVNVRRLEVIDNILSQNLGGQVVVRGGKRPGDITVKGNVIDGPTEAIGENVTAPVTFADPARGDFTVTSGPPASDAGARPNEGAPRSN